MRMHGNHDVLSCESEGKWTIKQIKERPRSLSLVSGMIQDHRRDEGQETVHPVRIKSV